LSLLSLEDVLIKLLEERKGLLRSILNSC
jgi:hypothetical protein